MPIDLHSVYVEFDERLCRFIRRRAPEDAVDDIQQDAYPRIHTGVDGPRDEDRLEAWLYRVTRTAVVDHYRSRRETAELPETPPLADDVEGLAPSLRGMIGCLPEEYREALLLSETLGIPQ